MGLGAIWRDSFFQYVQNFTFGAGGTDNFIVTIPIQADAHFLCVMTTYANNAQDTGVPSTSIDSGGALIQITDVSAQRQLSSAQVPINALFGTAQRPYVWPLTHAFRANGGIGINITGIGAAMANKVIRVVFGGFKVPIGAVPELDHGRAV